MGLRGSESGELTSSQSIRDTDRRPLLIAVVSLVTVVAFESLAVTTVMPIVERDLGEIWLYGWVFAAFYIGTLIGVVVGGNIVDHIRPIGPMLVGIGLFIVGLFAGGLAINMEMLVAGRLLQGLGAGVVPAVSYVVVARGFPADLHPRVFAAMSSAWIVPALVSPLVAAYIARHVSWRWVFLGLIPVTLLVTAVGAPRVAKIGRAQSGDGDGHGQRGDGDSHGQGDEGEGERQPDRGGIAEAAWRHGSGAVAARILVLAFGAALAISGLGMNDPVVGLPVAAIGAAVLFVVFRRLTPPGTLRFIPRLPAAVMLRGVLTYSFFSADAFVALAVTSVRGMTTTFAGFALIGSSGSWTIGSWVQARFMNAVSSGPAQRRYRTSSILVRAGGGFLTLGAVGMIASLSSAVPVWCWILCSTTMGLGMGLGYTTISVVTLSEADKGREGEATAALQMSDILGIAMGTGIAGAFVAIGDRIDSSAAVALVPIFGISALAGLVVFLAAARLAVAPRPASPSSVPAQTAG